MTLRTGPAWLIRDTIRAAGQAISLENVGAASGALGKAAGP